MYMHVHMILVEFLESVLPGTVYTHAMCMYVSLVPRPSPLRMHSTLDCTRTDSCTVKGQTRA